MNQKRSPLYRLVRSHERGLLPLRRYLKKSYSLGDGRATVFIHLPESPYSPYSIPPQRALRRDLFDYIDEKTYPIPLNVPVRLLISGAPEGEEEPIRDLIHEHYNLHLQDKRDDLRMNAVISAILLAAGLIALVAFFIWRSPVPALPIRELLSLVVWFALWEAADSFFFERGELRLEYLIAGQIAISQIDFERETAADGSAETSDKGEPG